MPSIPVRGGEAVRQSAVGQYDETGGAVASTLSWLEAMLAEIRSANFASREVDYAYTPGQRQPPDDDGLGVCYFAAFRGRGYSGTASVRVATVSL